MRDTLPPTPSLHILKQQARTLQRAHAKSDPSALALVDRHLPGNDGTLILAKAQTVIARKYGLDSWARLRARVFGASPPATAAEVAPELAVYEQQAADLLSTTPSLPLDGARLRVAHRRGFRTWWRLVAAVDAERRAALPVKLIPAGAEWKDIQREKRDLLKAAQQGSPPAVERFRERMLKYSHSSTEEIAAAVDLKQARYVIGEEYGGAPLFEHRFRAARSTPAEKRAWIESIWQGHDRLGWSQRRRADMSSREQEFVEAAMGDWVRQDLVASLPRLQAMADEDPSLIDTAGPAALARALYWKKGDPIVRFLLEKGARIDHQPGIFGPLHEAVWQNQTKSVRMLLEGGEVDAAQIAVAAPHDGLSSHRSLLHISASFGFVEMTDLLLQHGGADSIEARLDETGETALQRAVTSYWPKSDPFAERDPNGVPGHRSGEEVAALLLEYGAFYDIHSASALNDVERIEELLASDPTLLSAQVGSGYTPLHWAARKGGPESVRSLLNAGGHVNADSSSDTTPLHVAAGVEVTSLLIERGADVNAQDAKGRTPLFLACQGGFDAKAEYLIVLGAQTSIGNSKGKLPLEVAAKNCLYMKFK